MKKFTKPAALGAAKTRAPVKRSRFAGVQAAVARTPLIPRGSHLLEVTAIEETQNPKSGSWVSITFKVLGTDSELCAEGDELGAIFSISGKAAPSGMARYKSCVMACCGYDDESEYDTFDPEGEFLDALLTGAEYEGGVTIVGTSVYCEEYGTKPTADGSDYYREHRWAPVEEDA